MGVIFDSIMNHEDGCVLFCCFCWLINVTAMFGVSASRYIVIYVTTKIIAANLGVFFRAKIYFVKSL